MKTRMKSQIIVCAALAVLAAVASVSAWEGPTQAAPNGNVPAPINTGGTIVDGTATGGQTKTGPLILNRLLIQKHNIGGIRFYDRTNTGQSWELYANTDSLNNSNMRLWNYQTARDHAIFTNTGANFPGVLAATGAGAGLRFFDRSNSGRMWEWYSTTGNDGLSGARLWNFQAGRDQVTISNGGMFVSGGVWTGELHAGSLQISGGNPQTGKLLGATDNIGTLGWVDAPAVTVINNQTTIAGETFDWQYVNAGEDIHSYQGTDLISYNDWSGNSGRDTCDGNVYSEYVCGVSATNNCQDWRGGYSKDDDLWSHAYNVDCRAIRIPLRN